jgi:hypothetical protein
MSVIRRAARRPPLPSSVPGAASSIPLWGRRSLSPLLTGAAPGRAPVLLWSERTLGSRTVREGGADLEWPATGHTPDDLYLFAPRERQPRERQRPQLGITSDPLYLDHARSRRRRWRAALIGTCRDGRARRGYGGGLPARGRASRRAGVQATAARMAAIAGGRRYLRIVSPSPFLLLRDTALGSHPGPVARSRPAELRGGRAGSRPLLGGGADRDHRAGAEGTAGRCSGPRQPGMHRLPRHPTPVATSLT